MPTQDFSICLVQMDIVWENPAQNRTRITAMLENYTGKPDLILLPEMWNTGFTKPKKHLAENPINGENIAYMRALSERYDAAVVAV